MSEGFDGGSGSLAARRLFEVASTWGAWLQDLGSGSWRRAARPSEPCLDRFASLCSPGEHRDQLRQFPFSAASMHHLVAGLAALERNVGIMCVGERVTQAGLKAEPSGAGSDIPLRQPLRRCGKAWVRTGALCRERDSAFKSLPTWSCAGGGWGSCAKESGSIGHQGGRFC